MLMELENEKSIQEYSVNNPLRPRILKKKIIIIMHIIKGNIHHSSLHICSGPICFSRHGITPNIFFTANSFIF